MRMMNKTQDIVPRNIINSTWYHPSLGVTTSKIMPLVGGLCHVQRTSTSCANMICPSSEDFVTYNGLWPTGPTWFAPNWRTLSRTTDFNPLGQHDSLVIGGLCHVQRTSTRWVSMICPSSEDFVLYNGLWPTGSQWSHNKIEHRQTKPMTHQEWHQEWRKTSTQRPTTTSSPRIRSPLSKMKWSNVPEWFEDFGWML